MLNPRSAPNPGNSTEESHEGGETPKHYSEPLRPPRTFRLLSDSRKGGAPASSMDRPTTNPPTPRPLYSQSLPSGDGQLHQEEASRNVPTPHPPAPPSTSQVPPITATTPTPTSTPTPIPTTQTAAPALAAAAAAATASVVASAVSAEGGGGGGGVGILLPPPPISAALSSPHAEVALQAASSRATTAPTTSTSTTSPSLASTPIATTEEGEEQVETHARNVESTATPSSPPSIPLSVLGLPSAPTTPSSIEQQQQQQRQQQQQQQQQHQHQHQHQQHQHQQLPPDSPQLFSPSTPAQSSIDKGHERSNRESRRTFTAEDGKVYFLPKYVHYRPESRRHSRPSLHLQLSAGMYLCNGQRCSEKGGNVDFRASPIVTKEQVLVFRAFRDLLGWRPNSQQPVVLHELLAAEVFRLWEKTRLAADESLSPTPDSQVISVSPATGRFGYPLPGGGPARSVEFAAKAGELRRVIREKRKRCTEIYERLSADPQVLSGSLEEASWADAQAAAASKKDPEKTSPSSYVLAAQKPPASPGQLLSSWGSGLLPGWGAEISGLAREGSGAGGGNSTFHPPRYSNNSSREGGGDGGGGGAVASSMTPMSLALRAPPATEGLAALADGAVYGNGTGSHSVTSAHGGAFANGGTEDGSPVSKRARTSVGDDAASTIDLEGTAGLGGSGRDSASAARRQIWYREVQANDARLAAIKERAERDHAIRRGELMSWMIEEEGGKHSGLGAGAGPKPASWSLK